MKYVLFVIVFIVHLSCKEELEHPESKESTDIVNVPRTINFRTPYSTKEWTKIFQDSSLLLEIRYATHQNFMKQVIYDCASCYLRPPVATALLNALETAKKSGYGFVLYDCYRPRPYQEKLWNIMPNASYVTPPHKGSMHNRGHAIDLGLIDLKTGKIIEMGTDFDHFGHKAHFDFKKLPDQTLENRKFLRQLMENHGFQGIRTEWWHFSYKHDISDFSDWLWSCD